MEQKPISHRRIEMNAQHCSIVSESYRSSNYSRFQDGSSTASVASNSLPQAFIPQLISNNSSFPGYSQRMPNLQMWQQSSVPSSAPVMWNPVFNPKFATSWQHSLEKLVNGGDNGLVSPSNSMNNIPEKIMSDLLHFKSLCENCENSYCDLDNNSDGNNNNVNMSSEILKRIDAEFNPYQYILDLVFYSTDLMASHNAIFNQHITQAFQKWHKRNNVSKSLNPEFLKSVVNKLIQMKSISEIKLLCNIFALDQEKELVKEVIMSYLTNHFYEEVCPLIIILDLQPSYTLKQVVLPLIFNSRRDMAEQYLQKYPLMQKELVKMLDDACVSYNQLAAFMSHLKFPSPVLAKIDSHYVKKVLGKLLKTFKIPIVDCPNLLHDRGLGAINFMIADRFKENKISQDAFEEMTIIIVKNNTTLQQYLVQRLVQVKQMMVALKIARILDLPKEQWPSSLNSFVEMSDKSSYAAGEVSEKMKETHLILDIGNSRIYFVDTVEKYMDCIKTIQEYDILGFDAEWRPCFGIQDSSKLALLQLAVLDYVFLLDIISLTQHLEMTHWDQLFKRVFCNPKILKLGFATNEDLNMIRKGCLGDTKNQEFCRILDLCPFLKNIFYWYQEIYMYLPIIDEDFKDAFEVDKGLSKYCRILLGLPLDKSEQMSDWERRPLRDAQINYAAMDAYCLLQVYAKLSEALLQIDLDINNLVDEYLAMDLKGVPQQNAIFVHPKCTQISESMSQDRRIHYSRPSLSLFKFMFAVDDILSELGRRLRAFGANVVMLSTFKDQNQAVKEILSQNRCFIASGKVYLQYSGYLRGGTCFCVNITQSVPDQFKAVCDHFNIEYMEKYCTSSL